MAGVTTGALVGVELPAKARKELPPRTPPPAPPSAFTVARSLRVALIRSLFLGCCLRLVAILGVFQRMLKKVSKPQT